MTVPNRPLDVIYSATGCGPGREFWVEGIDGTQLSCPEHIGLWHELVHAEDFVLSDWSYESHVLDRENELRAELGEPLRATTNNGGCRPIDTGDDDTDTGDGTRRPRYGKLGDGCFVATAAHEHDELAPEVQMLREIRDGLIRKTRWGREEFDYAYEHYRNLSPILVAAMDSDERLRNFIRDGIVGPLVLLAKLIRDFPEADTHDVPEPWKPFLDEMRDGLDNLTSFIDLPESFTGDSVWDIAEELTVTLRYLLRGYDKRQCYLHSLKDSGVLPLSFINQAQHSGVQYLLELRELHPEEIRLIIGDPLY